MILLAPIRLKYLGKKFKMSKIINDKILRS